jgi:CubicO group peptidase (beta-lactamase class C family)
MLASGLAAGLGGAANAAESAFAPVTAYLDAGYRSLDLPGCSMLVWRKGVILYERYFGTYTAETDVPIASSSKWLSAAVLMTLVDEGRIALDAPISTYLPQFTGVKGQMKIRQMFSHTSGLVDPGEREWNYTITMAEYADRMAREGRMAAEPGAEFRYGSASMQVVGAVAEKVTGKAWNDLFLERIAKPCDMPKTTFAKVAANTNPMLAGGAWSSLPDYTHYMEMIAGRGVYRGRRVISEASVREMQRDQSGAAPMKAASNDRMGRASHYGLGEWLDVQAPDGRPIQVSSPGAFGFRPWLNLDRGLFGVFMMRRAGFAAAYANGAFDPWKLIDLCHEAADRVA